MHGEPGWPCDSKSMHRQLVTQGCLLRRTWVARCRARMASRWAACRSRTHTCAVVAIPRVLCGQFPNATHSVTDKAEPLCAAAQASKLSQLSHKLACLPCPPPPFLLRKHGSCFAHALHARHMTHVLPTDWQRSRHMGHVLLAPCSRHAPCAMPCHAMPKLCQNPAKPLPKPCQ
jgi:hypothetical protein